MREVREETGLETEIMELLGIYSDPGRDPRGHFVTAVYHLKSVGGKLRPGDDARAAEWVPFDKLPPLSFDHGDIVAQFMRRGKG